MTLNARPDILRVSHEAHSLEMVINALITRCVSIQQLTRDIADHPRLSNRTGSQLSRLIVVSIDEVLASGSEPERRSRNFMEDEFLRISLNAQHRADERTVAFLVVWDDGRGLSLKRISIVVTVSE